MQQLYDTVKRLADPCLLAASRRLMLNEFARGFGWQPSDQLLGLPADRGVANAHLVVEHGLEDTAVLSFLTSERRYRDLSYGEQLRLLGVSYNSLVDWHIHVHPDEASFVFNRTKPPTVVERVPLSRSELGCLRRESFEGVLGQRPSPNVPALDDALVATVSWWRRNLMGQTDAAVSPEALSALFNTIILVRAAEDQRRRTSTEETPEGGLEGEPDLLAAWDTTEWREASLGDLLLRRLHAVVGGPPPPDLVDASLLAQFDLLDRETGEALLRDFYDSRFAPYRYDFALISKHALSRIYEHYVSVLRLEESPQALLPIFHDIPAEERDRAHGHVWTPQFVARFFARYLREQMPPREFRNLRAADPACGSGIFLRSLLELQCEHLYEDRTRTEVQGMFERVLGVDIDANACQAARLSLALLHLVVAGEGFPARLNVHTSEVMDYLTKEPSLKGEFGAVLANPPFVPPELQSIELRERVRAYMATDAGGKVDLYLVFLRAALDLLEPGGYGLFVLPRSFLLSRTARSMRLRLRDECWIRCVVDLSAVPVFADVDSYVVLLIFQRKPSTAIPPPRATMVKCHGMPSLALQETVEGRASETELYSIHEVGQDYFDRDTWPVLSRAEASTRQRLGELRSLSEFVHIRQGFISGADDVFIRPRRDIPPGEAEAYVPVLHDRAMRPYTVPSKSALLVFYPYVDEKAMDEETLAGRFPKTWAYLCAHRGQLERRKTVGRHPWWRPTWPRQPQSMLRPKIVTPHVVLTPRFAYDRKGQYAVSHGPFLYPRSAEAEDDVLRFFLAVLNSPVCYWHIASHSDNYARGYALLEPKTLGPTPVPDPSTVPTNMIARLLDLVDTRLVAAEPGAIALEAEIDEVVSQLYGLSPGERRAMGLGPGT
ncbi:MAG: hypothetical protein FJX75_26365 [Armatimonadetes bacterium]|nr:hypothetical protein [Armatimonadota bacterium]